jgi:hypothetical protein
MANVFRVIVVCAAMSAAVSAQWPSYPTAGAPKNPDGTPNLNAPAPRAADGKPDLSGLWEPGVFAGAQAEAVDGAPGGALFGDVSRGVAGGLPLRPWAAEVVRKRKADNSKDNPDANCLPMGIMQNNTHPYPRKIVQGNPHVIVVLYEIQGAVRQIFLDGRSLPNNDPQPFWSGYSVGKWDGDTLVVESSGFRDDGWLDTVGNPLTGAGKMIERFRRPNFGTLEMEVTVDDPKAYTKPFTVKFKHRIMLDTELIEHVCLDRSSKNYVGADFVAK